MLKIFFDGGYRPDPVGMEIAVVLRGVSHVHRDVGPGSSIDAEWLALIAALRLARQQNLTQFVLMGDCAPVVAQANGTARCPARYQHHLAAARALVPADGALRVRFIKRSQNLAGIALAQAHPR